MAELSIYSKVDMVEVQPAVGGSSAEDILEEEGCL